MKFSEFKKMTKAGMIYWLSAQQDWIFDPDGEEE